jgi:hypothetical protein
LHKIDRYSALAERAAGQAVSSANQLVGQVKQMQLVALDTAPAEVQSTEWFKQFKDGVKHMNSTSEASLLSESSIKFSAAVALSIWLPLALFL